MKSSNDIRVLQLIDSLEPGGAERIAVTLANELANYVGFSALVATRMEGGLQNSIHDNVPYFFVKKKKSIDFGALSRLRGFVKANQVSIVHAHGSSYFFAVLLKLTMPSLRIFWHDHFGNRPDAQKHFFLLRFLSVFFSGVFTVNEALRIWSRANLHVKDIQFLPNFISSFKEEIPFTVLKGEEGKRIVFLANLHPPKNHLLALKKFMSSNIANEGWTLHLIGKDKYDSYSNELKDFINSNGLAEHIFIYGSRNDVSSILKQASAGLLVSTYEGFPVTLLEYGMASLTVICSDVGYCQTIIQHDKTGYLFSLEKEHLLEEAFITIAKQSQKNEVLAKNLNTFVNANYTSGKIIQEVVGSYLKHL